MNDTPTNPFAILGLAPRFEIDESQLQQAFVRKSAAAHPDRRVGDPAAQAEAARDAAKINEAHRTLKSPESRAAALLEMLGGPGPEDRDLPDGLLEEMLEVRETMAEAQAEDEQPKLDELEQWAEDRQSQHLDRIGELFREVEASDSPDARTLKQIRVELNALRYYQRMIEQLAPDFDADSHL